MGVMFILDLIRKEEIVIELEAFVEERQFYQNEETLLALQESS
jgi:hypothetical protein